jgi:hypothetical protein
VPAGEISVDGCPHSPDNEPGKEKIQGQPLAGADKDVKINKLVDKKNTSRRLDNNVTCFVKKLCINKKGSGAFNCLRDAIVLLPYILKNGTKVGDVCGWRNFNHQGEITVCENLSP